MAGACAVGAGNGPLGRGSQLPAHASTECHGCDAANSTGGMRILVA